MQEEVSHTGLVPYSLDKCLIEMDGIPLNQQKTEKQLHTAAL